LSIYQRSIGLTLLVLLFSGCGSDVSTPETNADAPASVDFADLEFSSPPVSHHDDGGRVQVELSSAWNDDGRLIVRAVFSPDDSGFHLYDSELPMTGVMGIGRPTLIEVGDDKGLAEVGALVADKSALTHFDKAINAALSVYPDGPVTLYLPIRFESAPEGPTQLPIQVTYMSCSDQRCNVPVERAAQEITILAPSTTP